MKKLKTGEVVCDECKGNGSFYVAPQSVSASSYRTNCYKCHGTGKLDWIENVVGKSNSSDGEDSCNTCQ